MLHKLKSLLFIPRDKIKCGDVIEIEDPFQNNEGQVWDVVPALEKDSEMKFPCDACEELVPFCKLMYPHGLCGECNTDYNNWKRSRG